MTRLHALKPGDRVALIAPSSPFDLETYAVIRRALEARGFVTAPGEHIACARGYLAGGDAERAEDLIAALNDPDVAAVLCIRGGYGSGRLLPWLPFSNLALHPKPFVGHSDVTFLHLGFSSQMGWTTFLGPNLLDLATNIGQLDGFLRSLASDAQCSWSLEPSQVLKEGLASGRLLGGNLTCLVHLLGTPYFPDLQGAILLIEDRGEALYRLDRMLTQLKLAGVLDKLVGLVLGQFTDCAPPDRLLEMVREVTRPFHFPIVTGLPFGHIVRNEVIPLGLTYSLNTYDGIFSAQESPFFADA